MVAPNQLISPNSGPTLSLVERAEQRLRSNSYLALRSISCESLAEVLILKGAVPTFYLKQLAQELVAELAGPRGIVNQIEVIAIP